MCIRSIWFSVRQWLSPGPTITYSFESNYCWSWFPGHPEPRKIRSTLKARKHRFFQKTKPNIALILSVTELCNQFPQLSLITSFAKIAAFNISPAKFQETHWIQACVTSFPSPMPTAQTFAVSLKEVMSPKTLGQGMTSRRSWLGTHTRDKAFCNPLRANWQYVLKQGRTSSLHRTKFRSLEYACATPHP